MGNTTIIELNHDRTFEIERNRGSFVDAILTQMRQGNVEDIPGGRVVAFFPRHDQPIHRAWDRWKIKWGVLWSRPKFTPRRPRSRNSKTS